MKCKKAAVLAALVLALSIPAASTLVLGGCESEPEGTGEGDDVEDLEEFHVYLCFGQSNMEGQNWNANGDIDYNTTVPDEYKQNIPANFLVMASANDGSNADGRKLGEWHPAVPPLCRSSNGLCPADYFGRTLIEGMNKPNVRVGVIVVAIAGCGLDMFGNDGDEVKTYISTQASYMKDIAKVYDDFPYKRLVDMAKKAQKDGGIIKGILLHQGETDAGNAAVWTAKVKQIYNNLLADLGLEANSIPLLAGEANASYQKTAVAKLPDMMHALVVKSNSSEFGSDNVHFSYEGNKFMGQRYGEAMLKSLGYSE